uniref:Uncharacterized protein n=1 Tax=Salix viminalis TaxID=40686 RepID=A0A6N2MF40_SALVM
MPVERSRTQKCFLHITISKRQDHPREDLIEYLIDGYFRMGEASQFDRGHTMLDQLENASLLEVTLDLKICQVKAEDLNLDGRVRVYGQLTRIPLTIPHSLKKIQVDPESLRNSFEEPVS